MRHFVFTASYVNMWRIITLEKCIQSTRKYLNLPHYILVSINDSLTQTEKEYIIRKLKQYKKDYDNIEIFLHEKRLIQLSHLIFLKDKLEPDEKDKITFIDDDDLFISPLPKRDDEFKGMIIYASIGKDSTLDLPVRNEFSGTTCFYKTFRDILKQYLKEPEKSPPNLFDVYLLCHLPPNNYEPFVEHGIQTLFFGQDWVNLEREFCVQNIEYIRKDYKNYTKL